jgi:hypothetical protein
MTSVTATLRRRISIRSQTSGKSGHPPVLGERDELAVERRTDGKRHVFKHVVQQITDSCVGESPLSCGRTRAENTNPLLARTTDAREPKCGLSDARRTLEHERV